MSALHTQLAASCSCAAAQQQDLGLSSGPFGGGAALQQDPAQASAMASSSDAEATLAEVLGRSVPHATIVRLLAETSNDVQAAVALHFAGGGAAGPSSAAGASAGSADPRATLRSLLGPQATDAQLTALLRRANQDVQAAAELWFAEGAQAAEGPSARSAGGARGEARPPASCACRAPQGAASSRRGQSRCQAATARA